MTDPKAVLEQMKWILEGLAYQTEYRFHPERKWRADYMVATPNRKCLVEIEGLGYGANWGRHQRPAGYEGDCEKYNEAQMLGWTVFRFTYPMVKNGIMFDVLCRYFEEGSGDGD